VRERVRGVSLCPLVAAHALGTLRSTCVACMRICILICMFVHGVELRVRDIYRPCSLIVTHALGTVRSPVSHICVYM
jgi:predicted Na+-dependent transporter